jgi:dimethylamine monooxygenase subunit A
MLPEPARYFPVSSGPLLMRAGLRRFGTDLGNGEQDHSYFPEDVNTGETLRHKADVLAKRPESFAAAGDPAARSLMAQVLGWMQHQLNAERAHPGGGRRPVPGDAPSVDAPLGLRQLGLQVAEDFVVTLTSKTRTDGSVSADRIILVHVCFPSGWRPERILGASFLEVHAPIPEFESVNRTAAALLHAMTHRGPYLRFVWTVSADGQLDHHPSHHVPGRWNGNAGVLRVERQITVPFAPGPRQPGGCLFLIRTYLYAFSTLTEDQRNIVASALEAMPESIREYKGLSQSWRYAAGLLRKPTSRV